MIASIDLKTLNQFVIIFLDCILFSELEENHNKLKKTNNDIINSINDFAPFLPELNPKYKYTLVLDMDETLVHFFFTKNIGMFFIRPYCFEFLRQLKEFYEIITFTAGTKEYADYILNLLDPNYEFIKYRLYRQHVTILGCSVYKDLNKLGRDLSKVIIVDNMKDNFKLQPPSAPTMASDALAIAFGDFKNYWIADRSGRTVQRLNELYSSKGQVGFVATERVDGKVILPEGIQLLKMKH